MDKSRIQNLLHYNMALVGGFFGGFTAIMVYDVFANAQTQNLIFVVERIFTGDFWEILIRVLGALLYFCGLLLSVLVPRCKKVNGEYLSIGIDAVCVISLALIPKGTHTLIAAAPIVFAAPYQWTVFDKIEGYVSATIFSSNNYRQFTTSFVNYLLDKDKAMLRKSKLFGLTLLSFHIGVALACAGVVLLGQKGALICLLPLVSAFLLSRSNSKKTLSAQK